MPAWVVQLGVDLPSELDTGPKMLLKRGVDVGRYGLPQHYNIVHLLARTAFMAAHGDAPMYEFLNPPPGAAAWARMQSAAIVKLKAHVAAQPDATKHNGTRLLTTINRQ